MFLLTHNTQPNPTDTEATRGLHGLRIEQAKQHIIVNSQNTSILDSAYIHFTSTHSCIHQYTVKWVPNRFFVFPKPITVFLNLDPHIWYVSCFVMWETHTLTFMFLLQTTIDSTCKYFLLACRRGASFGLQERWVQICPYTWNIETCFRKSGSKRLMKNTKWAMLAELGSAFLIT